MLCVSCRSISTAFCSMQKISRNIIGPSLEKSKSWPRPSPPGTPTQRESRRRRRKELRKRGWGDWWYDAHFEHHYRTSFIVFTDFMYKWAYTSMHCTVLEQIAQLVLFLLFIINAFFLMNYFNYLMNWLVIHSKVIRLNHRLNSLLHWIGSDDFLTCVSNWEPALCFKTFFF